MRTTTTFKDGHKYYPPKDSVDGHLSEEHRKKLGDSQRGRSKNFKHTEEWKKNLSERMKGNKFASGRVMPEAERLARSKKNRGPDCRLWKGGVTPINESIRKSAEYKIWRDAVYKRDNWTCQSCGVYGVDVHADHIKPFAFFPELRFDVDNGRVLCVPCHRSTDTWGYGSVKLYGSRQVVT